MKRIKVSYMIKNDKYRNSSFLDFLLFLKDISHFEQNIISWVNSEEQCRGCTDYAYLEKWQNNQIRISFPEFYDNYEENKNCIFITKENFIQFLTDWEAFGKSSKKYMMLREENGWISLEDVKEDENG